MQLQLMLLGAVFNIVSGVRSSEEGGWRGGRPQAWMYKWRRFLIALAASMTEQISQQETQAAPAARAAAFSVHVFTALGAGLALLALLEAVREHWAAMFFWLGFAQIIDGVDGPLARRLDVERLQPNWSGDVLDLVVDFVSYVFVPAYAITAGGLLLPRAAPFLGVGIAVTGALYFADRRMKGMDNHFRGFPGLWNFAAYYLFLLRWPSALSSLAVLVLIVATFLPFHVLHPVRTLRLRRLNLALVILWALVAIYTLLNDLEVGAFIKIVMCAIAAYIVACDGAIRFLRSLKA